MDLNIHSPSQRQPGPGKRTGPYVRCHFGVGRYIHDGAPSWRGHLPAGCRPGHRGLEGLLGRARVASFAASTKRLRCLQAAAHCFRTACASNSRGREPDQDSGKCGKPPLDRRRFAAQNGQRRNAARSAGRPRSSPRRPPRAGSRHRPARAPRTRRRRCGAVAPPGRAVPPAAGHAAGRRTGGGSATSRAPHRAAPGTGPPARLLQQRLATARPVTASHRAPLTAAPAPRSPAGTRDLSLWRSSTSSAR